MFIYCGNDPVNMSDETGYWPKWLRDLKNGIMDGFVDAFTGIVILLLIQYRPLSQLSVTH